MLSQFLVGNRIYLRSLEKNDLRGDYLQWLNDQETTKWMQHGIFPNTHNSLESYYESTRNSLTDLVLAIVLKEQERHIGNIGLHVIHSVLRTAEVGILIGAKDVWGQGLGSEAIRLVVDHSFSRMNLNRLYTGIVVKNIACIRAFEKAGFIHEGVAREAHYYGGNYMDCLNLGLLRSDWLNSQNF